MGRFTVAIPKDMKMEMDVFSSINWSNVAKETILKKLTQLKKFDSLIKKGEL